MKKDGILRGGEPESHYPQGWINPTIVAETHPIFSVQRNGDVIFRRVTPNEFRFLKMQEKWFGKAGFNVWRWRGTLRRPEAPEKENVKVSKRIAERLARLVLRPARKPAMGLVGARVRLRRLRRR